MASSFFEGVITGTFIDRPNRFIVHCLVEGKKKRAYLQSWAALGAFVSPSNSLSHPKPRWPKDRVYGCCGGARRAAYYASYPCNQQSCSTPS
ncbi:Sugar fermentation stimulation protein A [Heliorestis convoluta]|uniref:Sugar fermentation stimulation protein A n=1 Tax=Heliorestis convoluta TaxID=356322 RepID=A0A5Q2MZM9_9FIRM|nr:hypothetical protein [Heliorestis convoluta]QGG48444.1 Sugar fermentation stimulation protein A [Heliorestis convoluta]